MGELCGEAAILKGSGGLHWFLGLDMIMAPLSPASPLSLAWTDSVRRIWMGRNYQSNPRGNSRIRSIESRILGTKTNTDLLKILITRLPDGCEVKKALLVVRSRCEVMSGAFFWWSCRGELDRGSPWLEASRASRLKFAGHAKPALCMCLPIR